MVVEIVEKSNKPITLIAYHAEEEYIPLGMTLGAHTAMLAQTFSALSHYGFTFNVEYVPAK